MLLDVFQCQLWCLSFPWEVQTKFGVASSKNSGWISQWLRQFWWGTNMMINLATFGCGSTSFDFWVATFNQQNIEPASSSCFFGSNTGVGHYLWCSNLKAVYEHPMFYNGDDQGSGHLRSTCHAARTKASLGIEHNEVILSGSRAAWVY